MDYFEKGQIPKKVKLTATVDPQTLEMLQDCVLQESRIRGTRIKLSAYLNEHLIRTLPSALAKLQADQDLNSKK